MIGFAAKANTTTEVYLTIGKKGDLDNLIEKIFELFLSIEVHRPYSYRKSLWRCKSQILE